MRTIKICIQLFICIKYTIYTLNPKTTTETTLQRQLGPSIKLGIPAILELGELELGRHQRRCRRVQQDAPILGLMDDGWTGGRWVDDGWTTGGEGGSVHGDPTKSKTAQMQSNNIQQLF